MSQLNPHHNSTTLGFGPLTTHKLEDVSNFNATYQKNKDSSDSDQSPTDSPDKKGTQLGRKDTKRKKTKAGSKQ